MKNEHYYQYYDVILTNGAVLHTQEPYDLRGPKTLLKCYEAAEPDDLVEIAGVLEPVYVKARNIAMISAVSVDTEPPRAWLEKDE